MGDNEEMFSFRCGKKTPNKENPRNQVGTEKTQSTFEAPVQAEVRFEPVSIEVKAGFAQVTFFLTAGQHDQLTCHFTSPSPLSMVYTNFQMK